MKVALTHLKSGESVKIVQVKEVAVSGLTGLTVKAIYDLPSSSRHQVYIEGFRDPVILWEGDAYDLKEGSFTHADIQDRIQELAASGRLNITPNNGK